MKARHGQVLILVLLVVVVALAIGLSIASRNITNLRTSTQTAQSQRSFSAAEGGVEDVLSKLSAVGAVITSGTSNPTIGCSFVVSGQAKCDVAVGDITANVNVTALPNYTSTIELGDVGQVQLSGATGSPSKIQVDWVKSSVPSENSDPASIELTVIRVVGGGNIVQARYAISPTGTSHGVDQFGSWTNSNSGCSPSAGYSKCTQINFQSGAKTLRIKPFWNKTTVVVITLPSGTSALPVQVYDVTSSAQTDLGVTRKVQVTRGALPQLPAVFDYALYSDGDIFK